MVKVEDVERKKILIKKPFIDYEILPIDSFEVPAHVYEPKISNSISILYAYNPSKDRLVPVRVNAEGQLLIAGLSPSTEWKYYKKDVSDTGVYIDFGKEYSRILVINDGPNSVYLAFDRQATTNDIELKNGEYLELSILTTGLGLITNSGETATVRIIILG